ncbi:hypothetical protein MTR_5g082360 [Medicago truncatula]|uniref:Uncharacterized protein n=1 Tax=Medicago truncatula TaxID=3880 RepID=G7KGY9_MEDTR|nr:hypothetical protein MTR_5g082360 [Medicago truncatula]
MANRALGRRDLFDGRLTNSGTKLIFRIIEGRSWPTCENSGMNLMVHSIFNVNQCLWGTR